MNADRGLALLEERWAALPAALARTFDQAMPALDWDLRRLRRIVATGVGSSEAHARFLVRLLEGAGVLARFLPLSALVAPPAGADGDALVVFSQGLSPNARLVLRAAAAWGRVAIVTAATDADADPAKREALATPGAAVVGFDGEEEYGTLLRVAGPLTGYVAAWRLATALAGGTAPALDVARVGAIVAAASARVDALLGGADASALLAHAHLVTTGDYGELAANVRYKVLEGLLLPAPPVWDLLHVAHGPFQQAFSGPATFMALARADAPDEPALLDRLAAMLDPARHRLVPLAATLPGALAILEHEALTTALVLRGIRERRVDQRRWPGRGFDAPLYALDHRPDAGAFVARTWPEVEADARRTAIVPLGATEQHGPHLPLAVDTWIADALAERLCARVGDAVRLPAIGLGCSVEHAAFPGTLDLRPGTLTALLTDVVASLARHGVARVFLFSAHGGNCAPLAAALPALRAAAAPVPVDAFTDLDTLTAALHRRAAAAGVTPAAAGHHAGEVETSILLALRPHAVRTARLAAGHVAPTADPQALFHPSLRAHAPDGTVGDPRGADAARGLCYLDAWVDVLAEAYRGAKNAPTATGSQSA